MIAPQDEDDTDLMLALARGNDPALNVLMRRWGPRLIAYLERLCGNHATACDLSQETFVRVYKHRAQFQPVGRFSTWLFTIATNLARNHARWRKRHPVNFIEPEILNELSPPDDQPHPDGHLEKSERAAAVRAAILDLPQDQREALLLSTYEALSHKEVAAILDTTEKVIEMRLYRARQILRDTLKHLLPT